MSQSGRVVHVEIICRFGVVWHILRKLRRSSNHNAPLQPLREKDTRYFLSSNLSPFLLSCPAQSIFLLDRSSRYPPNENKKLPRYFYHGRVFYSNNYFTSTHAYFSAEKLRGPTSARRPPVRGSAIQRTSTPMLRQVPAMILTAALRSFALRSAIFI